MFQRLILPLVVLAALASSACTLFSGIGQQERDRAAIETSLRQYLAERSGLNLDAMNWDIIEFNLDRDRAEIRVMFKAKDSGATMHMIYDMERQGDAWVVRRSRQPGATGSLKAPSAQPADTELPPGHPPVSQPSKTQPAKNQ